MSKKDSLPLVTNRVAEQDALKERLKKLEAAMLEFCERVEKGEVRSICDIWCIVKVCLALPIRPL